jgi:hypothetical protein
VRLVRRSSKQRTVLWSTALLLGCAPTHAKSSRHDASAVDAGQSARDGSVALDDGSVASSPCERPDIPLEGESLAAAAIFADANFQQVQPCFRSVRPAFELWSDGLVAARFLYLPAGTKIDGTSLEHFRFPVGARALKKYSTAEGRPVELRVIEHTSSGYRFGSYVYLADGKDAVYTELGGTDMLGLSPRHEVPSAAQCNRCHGGEPGRLLAVSAFQLGRGGEPSLETLLHEGLLDLPDLANVTPAFEDDVAERALGALHVNCGTCHSDTGEQSMLDYVLRVEADALTPEDTALYATNVGITLTTFSTDGVTLRIKPGAAELSGTYLRAVARDATQMPDIATRLRNLQLEEQVSAWIDALPP